MDADSKISGPAVPAAGAAARRRESATTRRGGWRAHARLKLIAALRGEGVLTSPGGAMPVAYELDIFGHGAARTVSGNLEGDFTALVEDGEPVGLGMPGARLRLDDGREFDIDLHGLDRFAASFEAPSAAVGDDLVPTQPS